MSETLRERVARAVFRETNYKPDAAPDVVNVHRIADAVLAELGLTEEWGARMFDGSVHRTSSARAAQRLVAKWPEEYEAVVSRSLTPWTEVAS